MIGKWKNYIDNDAAPMFLGAIFVRKMTLYFYRKMSLTYWSLTGALFWQRHWWFLWENSRINIWSSNLFDMALLVGKQPGILGSSGMWRRNLSKFFFIVIMFPDESRRSFGRELNIRGALLMKLLRINVAAWLFDAVTGGVVKIFPLRAKAWQIQSRSLQLSVSKMLFIKRWIDIF